ncbi:MAG: phosphatase PAP2 family protein [Caulobacteraceae bacterium]
MRSAAAIAISALAASAIAAGLTFAQPADPAPRTVPAPAAGAVTPPPAAPVTAAAPRITGYLTPETAPDAAVILPPAPVEGTERYAQDRAIFRATRILEGTPRWALAINDDTSAVPAMYRNFACALGANITPETAPRLTLLLMNVGRDAGLTTINAKRIFQRKRPFLQDAGNICIARTDALAENPDYPSGHTTWGWSFGLILSELAPDRSTAIMTRARAFGESRVVCGVHNASAIEGGRSNGAGLVAALHGNPQFRADLEASRAEVTRIRATGPAPDAEACRAQIALYSPTPYPY